MNNKLRHVIIAFLIYFASATLIEFVVGWGMKNPWPFIVLWALCLSLANVFLFRNVGKRKMDNEIKK